MAIFNSYVEFPDGGYGGSINGGTHKWMVYNGKYQEKTWMRTGGTPISGNPHMALYNEHDLDIIILSKYQIKLVLHTIPIVSCVYIYILYNITI